MKLLTILLLIPTWLSFSADFCFKSIENPYPEPYVNLALRKRIEMAILESGGTLKCADNSKDVSVIVKDFREEPIAYTAFQRVNFYSLTLSITLNIDNKEKTYTQTVSYPQPSGSLGNIPRRRAIDDIVSIIYLEIVQDIRRWQ